MFRVIGPVAVLAVAVAVVLTAGTPVPVGVVTSDSMAPTLEPGDRFLALPPGLLGGVEPGDVAVFRGHDGWTVHRVARGTPEGFLTAGDANALTDQADGAPPVPSVAVVGVVPTVAGRPVAGGSRLGPILASPVPVAVALGAVALHGRRLERPPGPVAVGTLVAAVILLGWLGRPTGPASAVVDLVENAGPVPLTLVEEGAGRVTATPLLPGGAATVSGEARVRTVVGWAPGPALDAAAALGAGTVATTVAVWTGGLVALLGAAVRRVTAPEVRP